jgi:hypothetical protein
LVTEVEKAREEGILIVYVRAFDTPTHYKTHTYTHPHITKQVKTTTVQVTTTTVQDIPK